ncbi:MAG: anthranilate phosphoribosyltransferase, partial [Chloroflexota bacterium]|nr:anthranilate phosphoribosyltransferase [Chloroflexota bacterium]
TSPQEVGLPTVTVDAIRGGTKEENAEIMRSVFQGEPGPFRDVVILNSAAVLLVGNRVENMAEGVEEAAKVIDAGVALDKLESFISISQQVGIELEGES